jgi:hypothetical protein
MIPFFENTTRMRRRMRIATATPIARKMVWGKFLRGSCEENPQRPRRLAEARQGEQADSWHRKKLRVRHHCNGRINFRAC